MGILTSFVGKGNIFFSGLSTEDFLVSFNNSSSIHFRYDDYGYLSDSIGIFSNSIVADFKDDEIGLYSNLSFSDDIVSDYGLVSEVRDVTNDYGYISWKNNEVYGTINVQPYFDVRFVPEHTGSGSLFTFISKTESIAVSPDDTKVLFSISGNLDESFAPAPHIGSGSLNVNGKGGESVIPAPHIGSGSLPIRQKTKITTLDGKERLVAAYERFAPSITTTGSLIVSKINNITIFETGISGKGRFKVIGAANESTTPAPHIGSGSLFTFISKTESIAVSPDDTKVLFSINGSASDVRFVPEHTGSGSLFTFISKTESIAVSPENIALFDISGNLDESFAPAPHIGSGSLNVNGKGGESVIPAPHIGSGSLFTFISKTESIAVSPDDTKVLFSISGSASDVRFVPEHTGSGSLFAFISTTEAVCFNPPENIALFDISGNLDESFAPAPHIGSGSLPISQKTKITTLDGKERLVAAYESTSKSKLGSCSISISGSASDVRFVPEHTGSGSLFTFISKTESIAVSPDDTKVLFSISGNLDESFVPAPHIGSGSFIVNGKGKESTTLAPYIGSGSLFTFISKTESIAVSPDDTKVLFSISGSASDVRFVPEHTGSGSIFTINSATTSTFYDYKISQKAFKIISTTFESFSKSNYKGDLFTLLEGSSINQKIDYIPPKKLRLIVI